MMVRRYGAEFIGTFAIVFAPVALAAGARLPGGDSGLVAAAFVSGLAVLAMVFALGPISAAHFNPAVTLGFAVARRFPWRFVLPYWGSQFAGALAAAGVGVLLFGTASGTHVPSAPDLLVRNVGMEVVITFFLMLVIMAVATDRRSGSTVPGLAIGMTVVVGVFMGGPVTGGSMNPARSFGPAVFAGGVALQNLWLYLVVPPVGAVLGALVYEGLRMERDYAVGAPNELSEAVEAIAGPASH